MTRNAAHRGVEHAAPPGYVESGLVVARAVDGSCAVSVEDGRGIYFVVSLSEGADRQPMCLLFDLQAGNQGLALRKADRHLVAHVTSRAIAPHGYFAASEVCWIGVDESGRFFRWRITFGQFGVPTDVRWTAVEAPGTEHRAGSVNAFLSTYGVVGKELLTIVERRFATVVK